MTDEELFNVARVGDGETKLGIKIEDKRIVIVFEKQSNWIALNPSVAFAIAKDLFDKVKELGYNVTIQMPKRTLSPEKYQLITGRVRFLLLKKRGENEPDEVLARRIVDTIAGEML